MTNIAPVGDMLPATEQNDDATPFLLYIFIFVTEAKNMGEKINDEYHQLCPFVSKDGNYLFFTSNQASSGQMQKIL